MYLLVGPYGSWMVLSHNRSVLVLVLIVINTGLLYTNNYLGDSGQEDWTVVAHPHIEARMLQYEENQLSFNLLALCHSPLNGISNDIAANVCALAEVDKIATTSPAWSMALPKEDRVLRAGDLTQLLNFGVTNRAIETAVLPEIFRGRLEHPTLDLLGLLSLYQDIVTEQKSLVGQYHAEVTAVAEEDMRVKGRMKNHTPAIHAWVQKLAEKGVLEDMV
jgi:ubiquitin carboxyl-terminal hydrolase L5